MKLVQICALQQRKDGRYDVALTIEDGSGKVDANSYASIADADAYLSQRGMTLWANLSDTEKSQSLIRACDYMQQVYRERWNGTRTSTTQALDWPRYLVPVKDAPGTLTIYYANNIVPIEVQVACIALALKAAAGDLAPDIQPPTTSESVGSISVSYSPGARQTVRYQAIDHMLAPLLRDGGSGSMAMLSRA
jgi:hypothetical protein